MNHPELAQVKTKAGLYLYDVCNDYSLCKNVSDSSAKVAESNVYTWTPFTLNGNPVELGFDSINEEMIYVRAESDRLNGQVVGA
jgi:hypothetical protein